MPRLKSPTKRMRSVKMKPVKAWAVVNKDSPDIFFSNLYPQDCYELAAEWKVFKHLTVIPVLITEIVAGKGRKKL